MPRKLIAKPICGGVEIKELSVHVLSGSDTSRRDATHTHTQSFDVMISEPVPPCSQWEPAAMINVTTDPLQQLPLSQYDTEDENQMNVYIYQIQSARNNFLFKHEVKQNETKFLCHLSIPTAATVSLFSVSS